MKKIIISNLISYVIWTITITAGIIGFALFTEKEDK